MTMSIRQITLFTVVLCRSAYGDMITTTGPINTNGSVTKMANDELTIIARYSSGPKTFTVKREEIQVIEFNYTTVNYGPPHNSIGIGPPIGGKTSATAPETPDTIVLRGTQRRACKLLGLDEQYVHCAGKDGDYSRKIVLRIILGDYKR